MSIAREEIRVFLHDLLGGKGQKSAPSDSESLLTSGRLDSLDVLEIVTFLEARHGLDFSKRAFDPIDFDSVDSIVHLVQTQRPAPPP